MSTDTQEKENKFTVQEVLVATVIGVLIAMSLTAINISLDVFVIKKIWSWFIMPEFGVKDIGWKAAAGISLLIAITAHQATPEIKFKTKLVYMFSAPLSVLVIGFIIKML